MNLPDSLPVEGAAITALVYEASGSKSGPGPGPQPLLSAMAASLTARGVALAGVLEHANDAPDGPCDVRLEVMGSSGAIDLSANRGRGARGCRLDVDALMRAVQMTQAALEAGAGILIVNKFGKMEAEGGGFRSVIGDAVARGVPVVIGVPARNLDAFRAFADGMAVEVQVGDLVLHHATAKASISTPSIMLP